MKKNTLFISLLIYNVLLFGQVEEHKVYNNNLVQGVWQMYANYTYPDESAFYKVFHIFKGDKWLTVRTDIDLYDRFSVVVTKYGFANSYMRDEICALSSLSDAGSVFVSMSENADFKDCFINIATIFELRPKSLLVIFSDECNYLDKAPQEVLEVLYKRGKRDKRDYINEFLDMRVGAIQVEKSDIYDSTQAKTKMYLIKDDIITVTGEQNSFIKIEYETNNGKIIKGLVKKVDVESIKVE